MEETRPLTPRERATAAAHEAAAALRVTLKDVLKDVEQDIRVYKGNLHIRVKR